MNDNIKRELRRNSHIVKNASRTREDLIEEIVHQKYIDHWRKYGDKIFRTVLREDSKSGVQPKRICFPSSEDEIKDDFRKRYKNRSHKSILNTHTNIFT